MTALAALAAEMVTDPAPPPAPASAVVCEACGQRLSAPAVVFRAPSATGDGTGAGW